MSKYFNYAAKLTKQNEGGYLVQFPDFPEAITQGENVKDALTQAADCLEEAIANRIVMKLDIPLPTIQKKEYYPISLHATIAAKTALYITMRKEHLNNSQLARKLHCDEKEVRRLIDPYYSSKISKIENALNTLGKRLDIGFANLAWDKI